MLILSQRGKVTLTIIAVTHHSLNIPGGAKRLCLSVIEAIRNEGHEVSLFTAKKTDWSPFRKT